MNLNKHVVFLMGPTASGKTNLAIALSKKLNTRLISVDSALIYQGMDIGTAKPEQQTLEKYPHYLIDICTLEQSYSAHEFVCDAKAQIEIAFAKGQTPVLVGGTAFYFNALQHGLSELPESTLESKAKFNQLLQNKGSIALHQELEKIDAKSAERIHPNDSQRIIRALEVFDLIGKSLSELQGNKQNALPYPIKKIILMPPRVELHQRIEIRFLKMMEQGFINEVKNLKQNPSLNESLPAIRCVGYRQAWQYLDGKMTEDETIEKTIIATRQLCKRQSTWLRGEPDALFLSVPDVEKSLDFIQNIRVN